MIASEIPFYKTSSKSDTGFRLRARASKCRPNTAKNIKNTKTKCEKQDDDDDNSLDFRRTWA